MALQDNGTELSARDVSIQRIAAGTIGGSQLIPGGVPIQAIDPSLVSGKEDKVNKGIQNGYASLDSNGLVPVAQIKQLAGMIVLWPNIAPPTGWLTCNGMSYSNTTYAALYIVLGTNFGSTGTTFAVPTINAPTNMLYIIKT